MTRQHATAIAVLFCFGTGCATASRYAGNLAPQQGPKASIYATYTGGLFDRNVHAWFKVDRPAYVMVAHLSGEGVIRVLYPESPKHDWITPANTSLRTPGFIAPYDGVPGFFLLASVPVRTPSARLNSYDGLGHAFIFVIASDVPLRFDEVSDGILWDEMEVPRYLRTHDPRLAVREYADMVTGGAPYTLRFADSYTTSALTNYADRQWSCAMLSMMPFYSLFYGVSSFGFHEGYSGYCSSRNSPAYGYLDIPTHGWSVATSNRVGYRPAQPPKTDTSVTPPRIDSARVRPIGPRRRPLPEDTPDEIVGRFRTSRFAGTDDGQARPSRYDAGNSARRNRGERSRAEMQDAPARDRQVERAQRQPPERVERRQPERVERAAPARAEPRAEPRPAPTTSEPRSKPPREP